MNISSFFSKILFIYKLLRGANMNLTKKLTELLSNLKTYWKVPMKGRYMTFREIASYAGGGIGAYMIITLGTACLLAVNNTLLSSTLGIDPTDMYVMYVIAVIANIPLTGIRANIIDNTRNKAGKYRPYIVTMAVPAAIICNLMVWFPYSKLSDWLGDGMIFGETKAYFAKCAIVMVLNLLLHFFYYFFYDAYENLIHLLSPNSQERTDVSSVKAVVYSLAPTLVNLFTPIIAGQIFHTNMTDIRVYRFLYPIITVIGIILCIVVYKYTEEKIVQARTHIVQIKFIDAFKAVIKNKYFWIISLAGWLGFLETSYGNIMYWLYNYGAACGGTAYGLIQTIYGNASLWGMLAAPFCIRKWGKKSVLIVTNVFNIIFILMMLPFTNEIDNLTIWLILGCLYLNALMGSFAHILNPAIQADIRDYQQYKTGERIDGMFGAVGTIGAIITLATSSVLPIIYEKGGLTRANAIKVTSNPQILNKIVDIENNKTVGQLLAEQMANGQNNYENAYSALYDTNVLLSLIKVLIVVAALGALLNVIPYIWYDFNELKQKSIVRVLKIRALFEDFGNNALKDEALVEGVDIIRTAKEYVDKDKKSPSKKSYKGIKDKDAKKEAKNAYKADLDFNDEIEISKFICDELNKFDSLSFAEAVNLSRNIYNAGISGLYHIDINTINDGISSAKAMPKTNKEEKEARKLCIEIAKNRKSSYKTIKKYFKDEASFKQPDFAVLENYFDTEDECDKTLKTLYLDLNSAKKAKDKSKATSLKAEIKTVQAKRNEARKNSKKEMDKHAYFNRAAKPYLDAEKLVKQSENYTHLEEIFAMYEDAKQRIEA